MTTLTTRAGKGSPLTNAELDANFTGLNADKVEKSGDTMTGALTVPQLYVTEQLRMGVNTHVREYVSGYSTTHTPSTPYEIGRLTFTGAAQNIAIVGEIRAGTGASVSVTRFIATLRSDTLPGKTFQLFYEDVTSLGRDLQVRLYNDPASGLVVLGYTANGQLQNIGWSITIQERGNYNYFQQVSALTALSTASLTEISPTATAVRDFTSQLSVNGSLVANAGNITTFALASSQVTTALGFTPYNATNPSGYITSSALTPYLLSATAASTYQPLDADLTAIAALAGASGFLKKTAADTWSLDTSTYLTTASAASTYLPLAGGALTGPTTLTTSSASDALRITQTGAGNAFVVEDAANPDGTPFVIDQNGYAVSGYTAIVPAKDQGGNNRTAWQYQAHSGFQGSYLGAAWIDSTPGPTIALAHSRSATVGTFGAPVISGDAMGAIAFEGDDSAAFQVGSVIRGEADANASAGSMPGRLIFATTPTGAAVATERLRIGSTGTSTFTGQAVINASGASNALRITQTGAGNALVVEDAASPDSTPFVVDAAGKVIIGTASGILGAGGLEAALQTAGTGSGSRDIQLSDFNATTTSRADLRFNKSLGATVGSMTTVTSGTLLGRVTFSGSDGANFINAATISAATDGTPGTNDMPGRLLFSTTADGASTPTERMRIDSSGKVGIGKTPAFDLDVNGTVAAAEFTGGGSLLFGFTSSQITSALGFTPYSDLNPSGYIGVAGARASVSASGALNYDSATGVFSYTQPTNVSTFLNDSGYLIGITGAQVTGALGYTPASKAGDVFTGEVETTSLKISTSNDSITSNSGVASWKHANSISVSAQESEPRDVFFSTDGTKMYLLGNAGNDVTQYALSTAWDITTASAGATFSVATQDGTPLGLYIRPDGLRMYVIGGNAVVYRYDLGTAWDVSTSTFVNSFSFTAQETYGGGLWFSTDGTRMFVTGAVGDDVNQYNLSTAWDITTAVYNSVFSVALYETVPQGLCFSNDGTKMWIVGSTYNRIIEYTLSTPWSVTTAQVSGFCNVGTLGEYQVTTAAGLFVNLAANVAYVVDYTLDRVLQVATNIPATSLLGSKWVVNPDLHLGSDLIVNRNSLINNNLRVTNAFFAGNTTTGTTSISGTLTASAAVNLSTTTSNISLGTSQTSGTWNAGGTAQTGTMTLGQSTGSQTTNIQAGATASGSTKTINFGTGGLAGSTTTIAIGSANGTTVTANGNWSFANTISGSISGNAATVTSITSAQVTTALGYTPYNATNPNGYTSNTGTVTSVALSLPPQFTVSGSPVTGSGTLTGAWASQTQATVLAAPSGAAGTPTFRALVASDIPTLNQNTTGNAATATSATNVALTNDTATAATHYVGFFASTSGNAPTKVASTKLTFNPSTGDFVAGGNVTAYSDERLKKDWSALPAGFIEALAAVKHGTYTRIDTGERQVGVSAQDVEKFLPEAVLDGDHKSLAYGNAALVACVKLAQRVIDLERRLALMEG